MVHSSTICRLNVHDQDLLKITGKNDDFVLVAVADRRI